MSEESRRSFFRNATMLGAGLMTWAEGLLAQTGSKPHDHPSKGTASVKKKPAGPPTSMESPDIGDMPFTMDGGTKVFHLIAEQVKRKIVPWKTLDVWGYNGSCPGPTIQVQQGDRVRIRVENRLPESTGCTSWIGAPIEQDGVCTEPEADRTRRNVHHEFTVNQEGTFSTTPTRDARNDRFR
jgi:FtsP/CotA-like multicopper oxidase with cupredoxin domain